MASKKTTPQPAPNRIWIELDYPARRDGQSDDERKMQMDDICTKANVLLARLGITQTANDARVFFYSPRDARFCFGGVMGYRVLSDSGEWFNLDWLASIDGEHGLYAHFEDLAEGFVGPFATVEECEAHADFCAQRGDGATYLGAKSAAYLQKLREAGEELFVHTPEEDKKLGPDYLPLSPA